MSDIHLIAAVATNGVIGDSKTNKMPWHLPYDLMHFKRVTSEKTVVMGRRTFESIGKPLPNRRNVVITSDPQFRWRHKVITYPSVAAAMAKEKEDLYAIGGQKIFEEAMTLLPKDFHITVVLAQPDGDVRFPVDGRTFLKQMFMLPTNFIMYHRLSQTDWIEENEYMFCITHFTRHYSPTR